MEMEKDLVALLSSLFSRRIELRFLEILILNDYIKCFLSYSKTIKQFRLEWCVAVTVVMAAARPFENGPIR